MRILVAGTGRLGASILEPLLEGRHHVAGLLLNGRRTRGMWGRFWQTSPLLGPPDACVRLARRWGVPIVWVGRTSEEGLAPLRSLEPDLLITCGFGLILKAPLLKLPSVGCVNVHSSLLPKHRGPMPFNWVILNGDPHTGVTFHETTPAIDGGAILDQRSIPVTEHDTAMTVYRRCCDLARHRIEDVVDRIESDGLRGTPQNEADATYDPPLTPQDLQIDWSQTAQEIDRRVRASTPYLPATFSCGGRTIEVQQVVWTEQRLEAPVGTVIATEPGVTVATGQGAVTVVRATMGGAALLPWPNVFNRPRLGSLLR